MFALRDTAKKTERPEPTQKDPSRVEGHKKSRAFKIFLKWAWYTTMTLVLVVNLLLTLLLYAQIGDKGDYTTSPPQERSGLYKAINDGNMITWGSIRKLGEQGQGDTAERSEKAEDSAALIYRLDNSVTEGVDSISSDIDDIKSEIGLLKMEQSMISDTVDNIESDVRSIRIQTSR